MQLQQLGRRQDEQLQARYMGRAGSLVGGNNGSPADIAWPQRWGLSHRVDWERRSEVEKGSTTHTACAWAGEPQTVKSRMQDVSRSVIQSAPFLSWLVGSILTILHPPHRTELQEVTNGTAGAFRHHYPIQLLWCSRVIHLQGSMGGQGLVMDLDPSVPIRTNPGCPGWGSNYPAASCVKPCRGDLCPGLLRPREPRD